MKNESTNNNNGNTQNNSAVKEKAEQAQEKVSEVAGEAKQQAAALTQQAKVEAKSSLHSQKQMVANELHGAAHALRETSSTLREQNQTMFAEYGGQLAERIDHASTYLEEHDLDDLVSEVENFARRKPELFIGGAFTLGLLAARFLKSSAPASGANYDPADSYMPARPRDRWRTQPVGQTQNETRESGNMTYTPDRQYPYGRGRGPRPSDMYPDSAGSVGS